MDGITAAAAAFALAAGAAAAFNPCGFALLPAYLTVIVNGSADEGVSREQALRRAIGFGAAMTLGFVLVFGAFGSILAPFQSTITPYLGYVTTVLGIGLIVLAIFLLRGGELNIPGLKFNRAPTKTFWSQVLYGISFALASLSCTIGVFLAVFSTASAASSWVGVGLSFLLYAAGMGGVVIVLSVVAALAGSSAVGAIRRHQGLIGRISGVLVLLAGVYVLYYGIFELRILFEQDISGGDVVLEQGANIQGDIVRFINSIPTWGYVALAVVAAALAAWLFGFRARQGDGIVVDSTSDIQEATNRAPAVKLDVVSAAKTAAKARAADDQQSADKKAPAKKPKK